MWPRNIAVKRSQIDYSVNYVTASEQQGNDRADTSAPHKSVCQTSKKLTNLLLPV